MSYRFLKEDGKIFISEIFYSIQGEGIMAGSPAVFIRTQGCNLDCVWCDTKDVWVRGRGYTYKELVNEIAPMLIRCPHIVLTGGEPLMRQHELINVIKMLRSEAPQKDLFVEVETNGTIKPHEEFDELVNVYNVSPKLHNSKIPIKLRARVDVIDWFIRSKKAWFKFVVENESDVYEIINGLPYSELLITYARDRILLMPQAQTREEYIHIVPKVMEWCKKYGFRFSPRLQIEIYDRRTGV